MSELDSPQGWHVARITIEAMSPLSCSSGQGAESDNGLVRDANGLPMIPGATLQGLLRQYCSIDCRDYLFGKEVDGTTTAARLYFSNALVHNSKNVAVQFPDDCTDPLLQKLLSEVPLKREHVRLDHRHGAAQGGKFDRGAVPKGTRFSFELLMCGTTAENDALGAALSGLAHPLFRIGGSGRRGYGKVNVEAARHCFFDSKDQAAFRTLRATPLGNVPTSWNAVEFVGTDANVLTISLDLKPVQPWRTGQGPAAHATVTGKQPEYFTDCDKRENHNRAADTRDKIVDLVPLREAAISWASNEGTWIEPTKEDFVGFLLPASGVRGPLLHRTLYHLSVLGEEWADGDADVSKRLMSQREKLNALFGFVSDSKAATDDKAALASPLFMDDVPFTPAKVIPSDHIRIDRFTGGIIQGALYSQELVQTDELKLKILIDTSRLENVDANLRSAFLHALRDLAEGRLALGAKSLGFCTGRAEPIFCGKSDQDWQEAWKATDRHPQKEAA